MRVWPGPQEYWIQERRGDLDGGFHYDKDESAARCAAGRVLSQ